MKLEAHGSSKTNVPLLALPDELLGMCLPGEAFGGSNRTYMRTCRRFLHLYLNGCAYGGLRLCLKLDERRQLATRSTTQDLLALACPSLQKLEVAIGEGSTGEEFHYLLLTTPAHAPQWTSHVTHLRVVRGVMIELIPAFLAASCPHLKQLQYRDVAFQSSQHWQPSLLPKLQQLQLHQCQQLPVSDQFMDQLSALPSLTHLSYSPRAHGVHSDEPSAACLAAAGSLSSRVRHLCVHAGSTSSTSAEPIKQLLSRDYLALESLHLPGITVIDVTLNSILQRAPDTIQVTVFNLQEDHSSAPCSWKQVCMNHVGVTSLARLPLSSVTQLSILPGEGSPTLQIVHTGISVDVDMDLTAKAVAAVQQCGGLTCQHGGGQNTTVIIQARPCSEQVFIASIPLLSRLHAIKLHHVRVTRPLLQALSGLLALRMIGFGVGCFIDCDAWPDISRSFSQVKQLQFTHFMTDPWMLIYVIQHVTNPITLSLRDKDWDEEDKANLKMAFQYLEEFNADLSELVTIKYGSMTD